MKKVLMLLSNAFKPDPRVHREAVALTEQGIDVEIVCWDRDFDHPENEFIDGIKVTRVFVRSTHGRGSSQLFFLFLFWLKCFFTCLGKKQIDAVHAHDFDTLPLGFILARILGAKLIYDSHESYIDMLINIPAWLKKMIFKAENYFLRHTDLVITVGDILKEFLSVRGAKNVCVVGNWQDPEKFIFPEDKKKQLKEKLGVSADQLVIVFIAHLGVERQLPQLIDSVKKTPGVFLVLGGYGACEDMARDAAKAYPNITYLGYVNPGQIPLYTAISDIVFYGFDPSVPNARFSAPNKLFEGLAGGKVILTCEFGEIGKIVKQRKCGLILKEYSVQEITRALASLQETDFDEFSQNAREAGMTTYNWNRAKAILLTEYKLLYEN